MCQEKRTACQIVGFCPTATGRDAGGLLALDLHSKMQKKGTRAATVAQTFRAESKNSKTKQMYLFVYFYFAFTSKCSQ